MGLLLGVLQVVIPVCLGLFALKVKSRQQRLLLVFLLLLFLVAVVFRECADRDDADKQRRAIDKIAPWGTVSSAGAPDFRLFGRFLAVGTHLWETTVDNGVIVRDGDLSLLQLGIMDGKLTVSGVVRGRDGRIGVEIDKNQWESKAFEGWEVNYPEDGSVFEVRDPFGDILLQLVMFDDIIGVEAVFYTTRGLAFGLGSVKDDAGRLGSAFAKWRTDKQEPLMRIEPICSYPANVHRGRCPGLDGAQGRIEAARRSGSRAVLSDAIDISTARLNNSISEAADTLMTVCEMSVEWDIDLYQPAFRAIALDGRLDAVIQALCETRAPTMNWTGNDIVACREMMAQDPLLVVIGLENLSKHPARDVWVCVYDGRLARFYTSPYGFPFVPEKTWPIFGMDSSVAVGWKAALDFYTTRNPKIVVQDQLIPVGPKSKLLIFFTDIDGSPYLELIDVEWADGRAVLYGVPQVSPLQLTAN